MLSAITAVIFVPLLGLPMCTASADCASPPPVTAENRDVTAHYNLSTPASKSKAKDQRQKAQPTLVRTSPVVTPPSPPHPTLSPVPWWQQACRNIGGYECHPEPAPPTKQSPKTPTANQLREVVAKLHLPDPTPRLGPDPSVNQWNMLAVGYPIWLWTDQPSQLTTTAHHDGLTFTLTATKTNTTFTLGDGHTKHCNTTTPYPGPTKQPSPTCSYTYQHPSPIRHPYTITATNTWHITWTTNGGHGTLTHTTTGTRTLEVGELQSLVVG